jgi:hypothetical protein
MIMFSSFQIRFRQNRMVKKKIKVKLIGQPYYVQLVETFKTVIKLLKKNFSLTVSLAGSFPCKGQLCSLYLTIAMTQILFNEKRPKVNQLTVLDASFS